jgi:hypothetical protein
VLMHHGPLSCGASTLWWPAGEAVRVAQYLASHLLSSVACIVMKVPGGRFI